MQRGFLILGLIQYFFLNVVFSQEKHSALNIETYSVEDGLSQSSVQNIFQDKFGYIWISTGDGLNCFDGDTFRRYYFNSLANASHQSNSMRHVANDGAGNLWIGTDHGLLFLDRADDELIQPFPEISDLINYPCIPLFCENDSVSVLVVNKGILNIHIRQHRFKRIPLDLKLADLSVYTSSENEKWFWFYPDNLVCISRIPGRGIHIKKYTHFFHPQDNFKGVLKMDEQKYLLATGTNLYLLHKNTGHTEPVNIHSSGFPDSYSGIIAMAADSGGRIWLATSCKGIIILNKDLSVNKKFKGLQKAGFEQNEFRNISILHGDGMGNLWFGSDGSGLGFYSPQSAEFGLIDKISLPDEDLNRLFVRCFLQDTLNQIWIGTYNKGLLCWDRRNDKFTRIWLSPETPFPSANDVYCLAPYTNGRILAGTATGLFIVDVMQKVSVAVKNLFPEGSIIRITDILQLPNGSFELLMNQKAFRLEPLNGNFLLNISPFPDSVFFDKLFQGKNNTLRAFTKEGFYLAHSGTAKFFEYDFNYQHVSLSVNALSEDDAGVLWLATNTGLIKMDAGGKIISFFDETAGFSNHHLYGILAGNGNNLWVSHNRGLSEFVKANEKVFNYQMEYGLQSLEFNSGAYYQTSDNEMFFGGISGFNYFFPDKINTPGSTSKVFIYNVFVNEKPLLTDSCWMVKRSLDLAYSQNTVSFGISQIDFGKHENKTFTYMLEGLDRTWILAKNNHLIRYPHIKPGNYTFKLMAGNIDENSDKSPQILQLRIQKPFWMTTSFIIVVAAVILAIIIILARYFSLKKIKTRLAKLERQREISLMQNRIASDLHDDVGSGLTRLAMMSDKVLINAKDEAELQYNLKRISSEARKMIDQLRVVVWALNTNENQLDGLIAYIHRHISDYLEDFPVKFKISIPADVPAQKISSEFKRNVYYAIREAVHNIIKHADAQEIKIYIETARHTMSIVIQDNGKGFDLQKSLANGHGLRFIEKRIGDLSGKVEISTGSSWGTIIKLNLPI